MNHALLIHSVLYYHIVLVLNNIINITIVKKNFNTLFMRKLTQNFPQHTPHARSLLSRDTGLFYNCF